VVLTAAHCLYSGTTGTLYPVEQVTFMAGYRNGVALAYRQARRLLPHPDYEFVEEEWRERLQHDIALIELATPIRASVIRPLEIADPPRPGHVAMLLSYTQTNPEIATFEQGCRMIG